MFSHGCDPRRATHLRAALFSYRAKYEVAYVRAYQFFSGLDFIQPSASRTANLAKSDRDATQIGSICEIAASS